MTSLLHEADVTFYMKRHSPRRARSRESRNPALRALGSAALGAFSLAWSMSASAHLRLLTPASWIEEDSLGNPQKTAPCGGEADGQTTGIISTYRASSTIEVSWQEGVAHPGHFRIALARERAELLDPPVTTTNGDGVTGVSLSAEIEDPPSYPVLQDGLFARTLVLEPRAEPFKVQLKLPDFTCERCTLQVVQFMAQHVPGYFYHHCADIRLIAADADIPDAELGPSTPMPAPEPSTSADEGGCALPVGPGRSRVTAAVPLLAALVGVFLRRRRQRCSIV